MAMGRNIRVSGRYKRDQDYSLLVEMRGQEQSLLVFPNNRVQTITSQELGDLRGEYDHLCDGYALLGNLTVPLDGGHLHFLVLATQCTSVGEKLILSFNKQSSVLIFQESCVSPRFTKLVQ